MMLMLAVLKQADLACTKASSPGSWRGGDFAEAKLYELEGKTLGIVGLGNIGKKVARRAKASTCDILYYDINRLTERPGRRARRPLRRCSPSC